MTYKKRLLQALDDRIAALNQVRDLQRQVAELQAQLVKEEAYRRDLAKDLRDECHDHRATERRLRETEMRVKELEARKLEVDKELETKKLEVDAAVNAACEKLRREHAAEIQRLRAEKAQLAEAMLRVRVAELEGRISALQRRNDQLSLVASRPAFSPEEVTTLIQLCHPDRHNNSVTSNQITAKLLQMRESK